jgi:SAM-dependent methyltransferase
LLANEVVGYLQPEARRRWVDVGCGTGALSAAVVAVAEPRSLIGVDPSEAYVAEAQARISDPRAEFQVGDANRIPIADSCADEVVAGLVLNFVAEPVDALSEMRRVLTTGGRATAYVWDYADGMQMLRTFWDAAIGEDASAASLDEGARFPLCREGGLDLCFADAGMREIKADRLEIRTVFDSFDDYWNPFLGQQGPAPSYVATLTDEARDGLRERLRATLPTRSDGAIDLTARAWICQGIAR